MLPTNHFSHVVCRTYEHIWFQKSLLNSIVCYFWMWSWFALFCAWIGVSGQVLDSNGRAVKNASITIDSNLGIFTAADNGYFYIPLTQGPHTLHIKAEGEYKCYTNFVNTDQFWSINLVDYFRILKIQMYAFSFCTYLPRA